MINYMGYGFDANELSEQGIFDFIRSQAPDDAVEMVMDILELEKPLDVITPGQQKKIFSEMEDWIVSGCPSTADYIVGIINEKVNCPCLLQVLDNFIVFAPIEFLEDDKGRSSIIKSRQDMQKLVMGYFPGEKITFGPVYDGVEWAEPNYFMD